VGKFNTAIQICVRPFLVATKTEFTILSEISVFIVQGSADITRGTALDYGVILQTQDRHYWFN